MIIVVIWLVSKLAVTALVIVIGLIDNKRSMMRLLGYVVHVYDAIVIIIVFGIFNFVCIGMYDRQRFHSCDVEWLKSGI